MLIEGTAAIVGLSGSAIILRNLLSSRNPKITKLRGPNIGLITTHQMQTSQAPYFWLMRNLDFKQATTHFLALGSSGSGKTVTIKLLMKSVLPRVLVPGSDVRALVYDAKTDVLPSLRGMGVPEERLLIMNPLDKRCVAWDMAKDITNPFFMDQVAATLIPKPDEVKDHILSMLPERSLLGS